MVPLVVIGGTGWASGRLGGAGEGLPAVATRFNYGLVPLGFGMWLAYYLFHFLMDALTFVPVLQSFFRELRADRS